MQRLIASVFFFSAVAAGQALAADFDQAAATEAVRKAGDAYVEAYNKHDAKTVAGFWSPDAVYINRISREQVTGREAIAEQFTAIFKEAPDLKLDTTTASIDFVSPNVAVERGTAKFTSKAASGS